MKKFEINPYCLGFSECIGKEKDKGCWNFSVISTDPSKNALENNYLAGYVQGKIQGEDMIKASRNNTWTNTYLCDPDHIFPQKVKPSEEELKRACDVLSENYLYLLNWIKSTKGSPMTEKIRLLLYRMFGIYDAATGKNIMSESDLAKRTMVDEDICYHMAYGDAPLSFMDIYFINAQMDLLDVIGGSSETLFAHNRPDRCSAFLKRTEDDIYWTHNSWCGFLSQSHTITYLVRNDNNDKNEKKNLDFVTQNSYCPGEFGSNMDFGFNGHGICFNETTHRCSNTKTKTDGIWLCWRAAAAEIFAETIEDFYKYITMDNTGTYLNGYMLIDVHTKETALIEMSDSRFVLFTAEENDKEYKMYDDKLVKTKVHRDKDYYNPELLCKEHIFGVNYPVSYNVANDLLSTDNRPKRRIQFRQLIDGVNDMESTKNLITYVEPDEPLSIYGRWDLECGNAGGYGKVIPDGAVDSKAYSANEVRDLLAKLKFQPNGESKNTSFWMLYGAPIMDGKPFVWSKSKWAKYNHDNSFVPDELSGEWHEVKLFID